MKKILTLFCLLALAGSAMAWIPGTYGTGAGVGTEAGMHYLYVDGARTDAYTANGSIAYPYKTIQAALDWCNADAATQMSTANGLWAKYVVRVAAGNYTENLTINNEKYLRVEMDGVRITGNVNILTTQGSGDYYSKIEFVGGVSDRGYRGRCGEITGKVYMTRNNDSMVYITFFGMNLMGDIVGAVNGTFVTSFWNTTWNALDANGNQTNTGTPYMYSRDLAIILIEGSWSQFKGHIADSAADATHTHAEFYNVSNCRFDLIHITPTNDMRMLNCRFDSDVTITARTLNCDNVTYSGIKAKTNTLSGCTIATLEPKLAGPLTDAIVQSNTTTSGEADGTRHNSFTVTQSSNPASAAEVTGAYFAINRAFGGNPTYVNNAIEGVARQSGIDSAGSGTIRGGLFRTYVTGFTKTQMGVDISPRTGSNAICRGGTGFFGARIYMAPYFATGFEDSITNFHGLWIYNESTTNKINNAIRINDAGTTGWDTLLNFSGATASVSGVFPTTKPLFFGAVPVKDTLTVQLKIPSLLSDTFSVRGTNCQITIRDAGTANMLGGAWFFNGGIQAYGGISGVVGTENITGFKTVSDSITQLLPYAKGLRPANPVTGMLIAIDGDTTSDSLLVYLGGSWVILKP